MPHTTTWEEHGIYWQFHGIVDAEEFFETDAELYDDPRSDQIKYWIWDGANIEKLAVEDIHVELIAASDWAASENLQDVKGAFITKNPDIAKFMAVYIGISKEFESPWKSRIFENIETARQWLSSCPP